MSDLVDLSPAHLAIVERILDEVVPGCEVRAFGSRATWTAKDYSDLDLAVVGDGPLDRRTLDRLKEAFEESTLPMRVDVADWHAITDSFRGAIEHTSVVLQSIAAERTSEKGWQRALWGDLATLEYGKSLRDRDRLHGPYKVYGTNGPIGWSTEPLCPHASVIIGRKGAYRGVHYSPEPFFVIDTAFYLSPKVALDTRWAYYQLLTQDINQLDTGSAIPSTSREDFYSLSVEVPPLEEQCAIARVLGALDGKIELNRRMSETLDEMARVLFRSWFVDFDPVHAKAEGRPSGLPPDVDALFPDSLEPSELGPIPARWQVRSLEDIATFTNGLALQRFPPTGDSWLPVIKIPEMRRGFTDRSAKASADINPRYIVGDGDVVFSWSGSLEIVLWTHGRGALNQHLFKVTSTHFPSWFYWNWIREHLDDFRGIADGKATTMGHIQRHHLAEAKVVVPPKHILSAEALPLVGITERQIGHAIQSRTLAALRDTLLPRLLSGELRLTGTSSRAKIIS